ncbi:HAMP domain-containing protein [Archangium violaceum]|uniref:ATP-binding protein n=1 Tax=Archangium violaceum TaxID=83451 RepID=UPI002B3141DE|nr:HAMP domain-containing protein [Archangium violaceum]
MSPPARTFRRLFHPMSSLFARMYVGIIVALVLAVAVMAFMATQRLTSKGTDEAQAEQQAEESAREFEQLNQGLHWLLENQLRSQPRERWAAIVDAWQSHFSHPIELRSKAEVLAQELPKRTRERLLTGQPTAWMRSPGLTGERVDLLLPLADSELVLVQEVLFGPPRELVLEFLAQELAILLLVLGVAVLVLTFPLYRHVTRLAATTNAFGRGELGARAETRVPEPIGHLARTFNDMAERIHRMTQEQQATLQAISHELRTPISRLHFALDMARHAQEQSEWESQLADMGKDVEELDALVEELLTYTRLHRDAPPLEWESIELVALVTELIQQLALFSPHLRIQLVADGSLECQGSPRYLRRAISNLIRNAQRHARTEIRVQLEKGDSGYSVLVDDDGPGIPPQDRERIFLPFTRLDDSRNRKTGGHGLGLAIVHRIMQAHQGSARVADTPLGGARITLSWPQR